MAPSKKATKRPQSYPGVFKVTNDPTRHRAPWRTTVHHNGRKTRSFHPTFKEAVKEKKRAERLQKQEGSKALGYSRKAHVEYEEAKRIVGDTSLAKIAEEYAARYAAGAERKTVREAVDDYVATKTSLVRSTKHVDDIRQRLNRFADTFGDRGMETIRRNDILTWLGSLRPVPKKKLTRGATGPKELTARSKRNFFCAVEALFNYAENRDWLTVNPVRKINRATDLPTIIPGPISVLTLSEGAAVMRKIESVEPRYIGWACLQYFAGVRDAESERFHGEWIERKAKRIVIPGWFFNGKKMTAGSKTRDDWVIDQVPPAFWAWVDRYPKAFAHGPIKSPQWMAWARIRNAVIKDGDLKKWPHNGFRHSAATFHLSAYRDPGRTSLLLRHRDQKKLWANYVAKLQSKSIGRKYLGLKPV